MSQNNKLRKASAQVNGVKFEEATLHMGPLPTPDDLAKYNDAFPDGANRIVKMVEEQLKHRMELEKEVVFGGSKRAWAGLWSGLIISIAALGISFFLILSGHTIEGTAFGVIDISAIVGAFIYGTASQKSERIEKSKIMND